MSFIQSSNSRRSKHKIRRGTFLVKMYVTIAMGSMLLMVITSLTHRTLTFSSNFRKVEEQTITLRNLGFKFRQELLSATQVKSLPVSDGVNSGLELQQMDGSRVQYLCSTNSVVRRHVDGGSSELRNQNTYRLADRWIATVAINPDSDTPSTELNNWQRAKLTIVRRNEMNDGPAEVVLLRVASRLLPVPTDTELQANTTSIQSAFAMQQEEN